MKKGMKMISGLLVVAVFCCSACGGVKVPIRSASDLRQVKPADEYERAYRVTFMSGETVSVKDEDLVVYQTGIGIRHEGQTQFSYYPQNRIKEVSRRNKTRVGLGTLIGLGAGAAAGIGVGIAGANASCSGADDVGDCRGLSTIAGIGMGVGITIIGTALGAAIGAAVKKKKKAEKVQQTRRVSVSVSPQVYGSQGFKVEGGGLGISGRF